MKSALDVNKDYITIAGQTAPGDGICLRDDCFNISANHVIVRYIRSRLGCKAGKESDAIFVSEGKNIIMDHCSASWSVDECFSCSTGDKDRIDSLTVQWCIIAEALNNSIHKKGSHGYGSLIRGCYGASYTYHHNLFAHNKGRNPRPGNYDKNSHNIDPKGLLLDFRNNVMYNWGGSRPGADNDKESVIRYNYVGNYGKPGTDSDKTGYAYSAGCKYFKAFYSGNYFFGSIPADQWSLVNFGKDWTKKEIDDYKQNTPFPTGPITTETALDAYKNVMAKGGASLARDAADARVIRDVQNGTGSIIGNEDKVGSWPEYKTFNIIKDTDQDGMADSWENQNGLNPKDPSDRNGDLNKDGYTNLEKYLNSLVTKGIYPNIK